MHFLKQKIQPTNQQKGVTTSELDELAAETAAHLTSQHPDYGLLAARVAVSNLHKNTKKSFSETVQCLHSYKEGKTGRPAPLISDQVYKVIMENADKLNSAIIYDRDYSYDYFGFKTLEVSCTSWTQRHELELK